MHVLGRDESVDAVPDQAARLGSFLAPDGSEGAPVGLDVDRPHAAVVVGKRGTGKSYTLGVLAEGLAAADGVAPVIVDPMGVFGGLCEGGGRVAEPRVRPGALPPSAWPDLLGLDPAGAPGSLLWRAVAESVGGTGPTSVDDGTGPTSVNDGTGPTSVDDGRGRSENDGSAAGADGGVSIARFRELIAESSAADPVRRAADNALQLAASWDVFAPDGLTPADLSDGDPTVLDCAGMPPAARGAVVRAVARGLYDARVEGSSRRLPWLLIDEAHVLFGGVAAPALRTLFTRGRAPGVSIVCATQRPHALPDVAVSQADWVIAHRLTAERDIAALRAAQPTYLGGSLVDSLPTGTGEALVVDDATETAHGVRVRERRTPHGGGSPRASDVVAGADGATDDGATSGTVIEEFPGRGRPIPTESKSAEPSPGGGTG